MTAFPPNANLRQLATRQDLLGHWAAAQRDLLLVTEALCGDMGQEAAVDWWRTAAEQVDGELADRLRGVAAVIEEADL